ncbi:MAG TPA: insulinase family protein [Prolixibacteraceae bacterium]|nr:insulinase family protein [Prolixibacteraceae bacterium]
MYKQLFLPIAILIFAALGSFAQPGQPVPLDPAVRSGKLSNGLSYYIRHNELPKHRAEFYIAQKVGSILEEENQRGLAHFLEHMCFNGTKNFPGNTLIQELEKKGIKFGQNINASTGLDQTIYLLSNIPVTREGIIDTALVVLHDWSGFVSLTDKDIDDERGVIREEWRTTNTGDRRVQEQFIKEIFAGTQYAERLPIGLIDVINTFPYQALRDYYKKWYRPDLQAIIVVGDINVDQIESKIKQLFADIPVPVNAAPRPQFQVPNNTEPIVSVVSDPEVVRTSVMVFYKKEAVPDALKLQSEYLANQVNQNLVATMFNQRMSELSQKPNPPISWAGGGMDNFIVAPTKRAWSVRAAPKTNKDTEVALRALLTENRRMQQYGFLAGELERAKINLLREYETAFNERDKQVNNKYVQEYVNLFLENEPSPGIEWEYNFIKNRLANISVEEVNRVAASLVTDTNMVFVVTGPKKEEVVLPTREKILTVWKEVKNEELSPYTDELSTTPLLDKKPVAGKITKTEQKPFGYTQWTLSNGVKVLFKRTDFKKDQVIMSSYRPGGSSLFRDEDIPSAMAINSIIPNGGIGQLNNIQLGKLLTGKVVDVNPSVNYLNEEIGGSASPQDFETMMQLTYLYFTQPRMDKDLFNTWMSTMKTNLENAARNPATSLRDTIIKVMTNNNPRGKAMNLDILNKVDYNKVMELYKSRFADAGGFTFILTGNVEADSIKALVETYLGGLPSSPKSVTFKDRGMYPQKGMVKNHFNKKLQLPKSSIMVMYTGEIPCTLKNRILMNYLESLLNIVYTETIREKEGGTYGVSVRGNLTKIPKERYSFQVRFDTDPVKAVKLISIVYAEIKKITEQSPGLEYVNKVKAFTLKDHQEKLLVNEYWSSMILDMVINGTDLHTDYDKLVTAVTPEMIRDFAKKIFSQGNIAEVVMNPEK